MLQGLFLRGGTDLPQECVPSYECARTRETVAKAVRERPDGAGMELCGLDLSQVNAGCWDLARRRLSRLFQN